MDKAVTTGLIGRLRNTLKMCNAVIKGLHLKNVILVGHSMGGEIILQTALSLTDKVVGFIGIDNFKYFTHRIYTAAREGDQRIFLDTDNKFRYYCNDVHQDGSFPAGIC